MGQGSLPTRCVTCPVFVGELLFVTGAAEADPKAFPDSVKFAGSLFRVNVRVQGQNLHRYKRKVNEGGSISDFRNEAYQGCK